MITKTCKEIYENAMTLSQTYNSDFLTFQSAVSFINDRYRSLYDIIVNSDSDFYVREFIISENDQLLPDDLYNIKSVRFLSDIGDSFTPINRCPEKSYVPGTYTINNNVFHLNGDVNKSIQIRYNPVPKTITMPFELEEMDIDAVSFGKMFDDGIYYTDKEGNKLFYTFANRDSQPAENYEEASEGDYLVDYDKQTVTDPCGFDLSLNYQDFGTFTKIFFDDPYSVAEYTDGKIIVFVNHIGAEWNVKATSGHLTRGKVFGLATDDTTGYGLVYFDNRDKKLYRAPFVTDTIMSYTNNTLFYLMEVQLAQMLSALAGSSVRNLEQEEQRATEAFYREIRQNKAGPLRVNNTETCRRFL